MCTTVFTVLSRCPCHEPTDVLTVTYFVQERVDSVLPPDSIKLGCEV